jgi:hypothetical protein
MKYILNHRLATYIDTLYRLHSAVTDDCYATTVFREKERDRDRSVLFTCVLNKDSGCCDVTHELLSKQECLLLYKLDLTRESNVQERKKNWSSE